MGQNLRLKVSGWGNEKKIPRGNNGKFFGKDSEVGKWRGAILRPAFASAWVPPLRGGAGGAEGRAQNRERKGTGVDGTRSGRGETEPRGLIVPGTAQAQRVEKR